MKRATSTGRQLSHAAPTLILSIFFMAVACVSVRAQLSTDDHLAEPGWWPRRKPADLKEFAGNAACAKCHSQIATSQKTTAMARTLMHASDADVLHSHSDVAFRNGKWLYQIKRKGAATQLTVTDGERNMAEDLVW